MEHGVGHGTGRWVGARGGPGGVCGEEWERGSHSLIIQGPGPSREGRPRAGALLTQGMEGQGQSGAWSEAGRPPHPRPLAGELCISATGLRAHLSCSSSSFSSEHKPLCSGLCHADVFPRQRNLLWNFGDTHLGKDCHCAFLSPTQAEQCVSSVSHRAVHTGPASIQLPSPHPCAYRHPVMSLQEPAM